MKSEFELRSIDLALQKLLDEGILKDIHQKDKLYNLYKQDQRNYDLIRNEINRFKYDKDLLFEKIYSELIEGKQEEINLNKKTEYPLSLENVTDFEKDGVSYIKIHYPYPEDRIRIVENRTNPHQTGKERFEAIKKSKESLGTDEIISATSIFEQTLIKECRELSVKDIREVSTSTEYQKLSKKEKEVVLGTIKALISSLSISNQEKMELETKPVETILDILKKTVYISPSDNIIVIGERNNPQKDETKTLSIKNYTNEKGEIFKNYSLKPLDEIGYKYSNKNSNEQLNGEANNLIQNDVADNQEYEIQKEDDLEKEIGQSKKMKSIWQKRKKQSAFISIFWFVIFCGILFGALVAALISLK